MPGLEWTVHPFLFLVYALAVYRLTRLVVSDVILDRPRQAIVRRSLPVERTDDPRDGFPLTGDRPSRFAVFLADLIGCPWCVSMWLAAGWAALACLVPVHLLALVAFVLAASALAGLLSARE